ncbi:Eco57I restriction-modification methylase domain-containing protein [Iamia sp.]|uniref:Eco57I restriction-modification methylase domain-containing protein n=1 Tax=Iamia sp. TaxID=2722710 RepID=UPI002C1ABA41|nr:N-6 DNA methylase [Iamia sp.]HXH56712.1 N-6 DNA methylase [Iamia sp.]
MFVTGGRHDLGPTAHPPRGLEIAPDPGADCGEVFTRRWIVDLILDLVGYTPDRDLGSEVLIEPSCGTGAFLVPVVERLIQSAAAHGRDLRVLGPAIRAFDLLDANAELARKATAHQLIVERLTEDEADTVAAEWVTTGDFLLHRHDQAGADYVVGNPRYIRLENVPRPIMDSYRRICPTMRGRADVYVGFIERGLELLKPGGALSFICADRWMRNRYGADLREVITSRYAVDTVIAMHDVDAFEHEVSAYPAMTTARPSLWRMSRQSQPSYRS